jgi:hypothetical protein
MAAVFLAGVRNVNPRPPGYAMHCVFMIHAAHLLSLQCPANMRHLPMYFALDQFKDCQAKDAAETAGDYRMTELTGPMPSPERAIPELIRGLEDWNADRAERAVAVASKYAGFEQIFDVLWTYAVRDFRYVGHKAIYAANAYRTLMTIGWQHAEPVLRSLVVSLVDPEPGTGVGNYVMADQVWSANQKLAAIPLPPDRSGAPPDAATTGEIVKAIRTVSPNEVCADVMHRLMKGASTASVWDAIHLSAAEMAMRIGDRNIAEIHALTSANAMHFIWRMAGAPRTRLLVLLQAVGWAGQARMEAEKLDAKLRKADILSVPDGAVSHVADEMARSDYLSGALKQAVTKANEAHYYKYPVALVEDTGLISELWRPRFAAAMAHYSKTAADPNTELMEKALAFM